MDLTVVIPTYNGAQRLPAVLEKLRSQTDTGVIQWEILVVDNNSQDATPEVVQQYQQSWSGPVPLRYVFEPQQGLAFARQCGVEAATGDYVGFLDDDNWPHPRWVAEAVQFGQTHPQAGAYGGRCQGVFEQPPPEAVQPLLRFLAMRDDGPTPKEFDPNRLQLPAGAGLVIRRQVWLNIIPKTLVRISRGGDDYEISLRLAKAGWQIWYNPRMEIQHFIPAARLERAYLLQLVHFYGLCTCDLLMIQAPLWQQPFLLAKSFFGSLRRILAHYSQYGWHSHKTLEREGMLAFHLGNLQSPFFHLSRRFRIPP